ncbi:ribulose bisphosphate carboxylase small subunit [Gloeocapsopsis dulcis]|uniref:Ribulose 1,5-bisphosphate carboxylase n=1 Tax=Gloeocapsopsis dulcis AAB1 = 1H9 TaxID=1433147 RepID=A0A6N8G214_9CHRO|nr:ribulose bisphosphate carboxylase small subunit [Gloeocapsopsis dulcis]MUL38932.1 ribulose 1,5-bisphosphate carboxylase [Gloeocapsopsis dulcis AAB1 = 1H9]WNN90880.1 ribulose bisphosphate carboxylase small subunit [Gloeocapsopsis dulcis]
MGYYIAPRFLNKLAVHITKNFLNLPGVRVPLILGIHGHKGEGKTFQCELVFDLMGVEAVHISGGELESPDAGDPARLIRLRYREAADLIRTRGKMAILMINDLDAGAGRFDQATQYTVNTQLVNGTLMNIADNPTNVQLPGSYDDKPLPRVPIIVTGNDLTTLYAPLVRDGRMEKFYWEPNREDKIGIVGGIFEPDELSKSDVETLVDTFLEQSIDFYGALRSRIYDEQILGFIESVGFARVGKQVVNSAEKPPSFKKPDFSLSHLIEQGKLIVNEQRRLQELRLAAAYNIGASNSQPNSSQDSAPAPTTQYERGNGSTRRNAEVDPPRQTSNGHNYSKPQATTIDSEVVQQVQTLLAQGYRIGVEYVDQRRFRTGSWQSATVIQAQDKSEAIATLESCLADHENEYVRVFGIQPGDRQRVMETIIQRPSR